VAPTQQRLLNTNEITKGSPYGAVTVAGREGSRQPSETGLDIPRTQGGRQAEIADLLSDKLFRTGHHVCRFWYGKLSSETREQACHQDWLET
jgi:hypothetical protein